MERVLAIFQANTAATESLALAFALGAVESGANIRLRHLADDALPHFEHDGYVPPKAADFAWAEIIALVLESEQPSSSLSAFLTEMKSSSVSSSSEKRFAYISGPAPSIVFAQQVFIELGFALLDAAPNPTPASMQSAARQVVTSQ